MIKRDSYLERIVHNMWNGEIKVITGIHRCGKSVLLFDLFYEYLLSKGILENHIIKIELDQRRYYKFRNPITLCEYIESIVQNPVLVYAVEVAVQLAIVELNENIREIYVEAYTSKDIAEYLYQKTAVELMKIFKDYNPDWSNSDFYESEIGSAGMMRSFMMRKCDVYFTLNKKIERFLSMSLKCYNVPNEEIQKIIQYVNTVDINKMANYVLERLFSNLEMTFGFTFKH